MQASKYMGRQENKAQIQSSQNSNGLSYSMMVQELDEQEMRSNRSYQTNMDNNKIFIENLENKSVNNDYEQAQQQKQELFFSSRGYTSTQNLQVKDFSPLKDSRNNKNNSKEVTKSIQQQKELIHNLQKEISGLIFNKFKSQVQSNAPEKTKKKLGQNIIASVFRDDIKAPDSSFSGIIEESEIINESEDDNISHFQEVDPNEFSFELHKEISKNNSGSRDTNREYFVKISRQEKQLEKRGAQHQNLYQSNEGLLNINTYFSTSLKLDNEKKSGMGLSSYKRKNQQSPRKMVQSKIILGNSQKQIIGSKFVVENDIQIGDQKNVEIELKEEKINHAIKNSNKMKSSQKPKFNNEFQIKQEKNKKKYSEPDGFLSSYQKSRVNAKSCQQPEPQTHNNTSETHVMNKMQETLLSKIKHLEKIVETLRSSESKVEEIEFCKNSTQQNHIDNVKKQPISKKKVQYLECSIEENSQNQSNRMIFQSELISDHQSKQQRKEKISNKEIMKEIKEMKLMIKSMSKNKIELESLIEQNEEKMSIYNTFKPSNKKQLKINFVDHKQSILNQSDCKQPEEYKIKLPNLRQTPTGSDNVKGLIEKAIHVYGQLEVGIHENVVNIQKFNNCVLFEANQQKDVIKWYYDGVFCYKKFTLDFNGKVNTIYYELRHRPKQYTYQGEIKHHKKQGKGSIHYHSGEIFHGQWKNDLFHGYGVFITKEFKYEGYFQNGIKTGFGNQQILNGDSYKGEFVNDLFHGKGLYVWKNGSSYQGYFNRGYMHGEGVWTSSESDRYEGNYYKSERHGEGVYKWHTGQLYQAKFKNGTLINSANSKIQLQMHKQDQIYKISILNMKSSNNYHSAKKVDEKIKIVKSSESIQLKSEQSIKDKKYEEYIVEC